MQVSFSFRTIYQDFFDAIFAGLQSVWLFRIELGLSGSKFFKKQATFSAALTYVDNRHCELHNLCPRIQARYKNNILIYINIII